MDTALSAELSTALATKINSRMEDERKVGKLRLSQISHPCDRKIWYDINQPELAEPLSAQNHIKFMYGDILEEMVLFLAKVSGHDVQGEQDELDLYGIKGHRDAVIDGVTVDVKSASSFSFNKFLAGLTNRNDGFGYLGQLDSYIEAAKGDPLVTDQSKGAFLVIDKQLGKIHLDVHTRIGIDWRNRIFSLQRTVEDTRPPPRSFSAVPDGAKGNERLDTVCSYCVHKSSCWPGLRTFLYASGPRFFSRVQSPPNVQEV